MKKTIKIIREIGVTVLVLFLVFLIYCMSQGQKISVFGYQVLRVLTSSMEPVMQENVAYYWMVDKGLTVEMQVSSQWAVFWIYPAE